MFGLVTKKYLKSVVEEIERRLSKMAGGFDHTIATMKESLMKQDKMYARSNQIKFNAIEKRFAVLEQILAEEIKKHHADNDKREIAAAESVHDKIEGDSQTLPF